VRTTPTPETAHHCELLAAHRRPNIWLPNRTADSIVPALAGATADEVQTITNGWLEEYNAIQLHQALGDALPYQFRPYPS